MRQRRSVLSVTDLTERSHAALALAAMCANHHGWDLDLLCALGVVHDLNDDSIGDDELHRRIIKADRKARRQALAVFPPGSRPAPLPVIDIDSIESALVRRAGQYRPQLVVLPAVWTWAGMPSERPALSADVLARFNAPALVVPHLDCEEPARVLLMSSAENVDVGEITAACRWWSWLSDVCGRGPVCVPDIEIALVDASSPRMVPATSAGAALVVVSAALQRASTTSPSAASVIAAVLEEAAAPVLLLPQATTAPPSARCATFAAPGREAEVAV